MSDELPELTVDKMDAFCRSMKAAVEMIDGPAVSTFEFPMWHEDLQSEVDITVRAFRCGNPACEGRVHVEIEVARPATKYGWDQERSDDRLFGGLGGEHSDPRDS